MNRASGTLVRWIVRGLGAVGLALTLVLCQPSGASASDRPAQKAGLNGYRYVEATGHTLRGAALAFYDAHGGRAVFGDPLTEVFTEDGRQVQYFENARFEVGASAVTVSALGRAAAAGQSDEEPFQWRAGNDDPERRFVAQSGHTLGGAFGWLWQRGGGLATFGYPISEEFVADGRLVQYFERALMIHTGGADVALAPLGRQEIARRGLPEALLARVPPRRVIGQATLKISGASSQHNVALAAAQLNGATVAPGATLSFLKTVGAVTTRAGYRAGAAIVSGRIVEDTVGGGICYVSTALYRAAFTAGLPIAERHGHSFRLRSYDGMPGVEAAVFTPGVDLRFTNDTGAPLDVVATYTGGTLTVTLWGEDGGRTTTLSKPTIKTLRSDVPDSPTVKVVQPAQIISVSRTVKSLDGSVLRRDAVTTRYQPLLIVADSGDSPTGTPSSGPR